MKLFQEAGTPVPEDVSPVLLLAQLFAQVQVSAEPSSQQMAMVGQLVHPGGHALSL